VTPRLKAVFERLGPSIEKALLDFLPTEKQSDPRLAEAMCYSVAAGGKRVRPILVLLVHELEKGTPGEAMAAAAAIEYIHTYSLIHDDLPAMDNDDLRRGKPTNHKVFGDALAILAGDGLLTFAFELLAEKAPQDRVRPLVSTLAMAAGWAGMVGGQAADIQAEGKETSLNQLRSIHARKTGALLMAAVLLGAVSAKVSPERIELYRTFGQRLGLTFQITDDILDCTATAETLGKTPGKDAAQNKATYPALLGLEKARQAAVEAHQAARESLTLLGLTDSPLADLNDYLLARVN